MRPVAHPQPTQALAPDGASPPKLTGRWAWVIPPNIVAVPFVHEGWWWAVDLLADECCVNPGAVEDVARFAKERGADVTRGDTVESQAYYLNPWPTVFDAFVEGVGDAWMPSWFDRRPIEQMRDLNALRRETGA